MSGIIGHIGANSGIIDAHPQGTIFYTDSVEYTTPNSSYTTNLGNNGDTYESSNLVISVPAATVAKSSKIYVAISISTFMNANVRSGDYLCYWELKILRTAPGSEVIIADFQRCGEASDIHISNSGLSAHHSTQAGQISGFDKNLGTGIHTYKLQLFKLGSEAVYGGNSLAPYGHPDSKSSIQVMAIAK
tara:strand:+ start:184 stop:750 length:567 start_codon:yes stop_codon:yes gene_type:complete